LARKYGNQTGAFTDPSSAGAPGSWISPTEVARQKTASRWPVVLPGAPPILTGSYVFAIASGISDTLVAGGNYHVADGSAKNRTTDSELFAVLSTTYGSGNGTTTYNLPDLSNSYTYLKTTTVSGSTLAALSGTASLPSHTHSVYGIANSTSFSTNNNGPPRTLRNTAVSATLEVGAAGAADGNNPRRRQAKILIARTSALAQTGVVFPVLLPLNEASFAAALPSALIIPSGQNISRITNPTLFGYVGTKFGSGDGSTTFGLPDLRGLFLQGYSTGILDASGTLPSGYLLDGFARHTHISNLRADNGGGQAQGLGGLTNLGNTMSAPVTGSSSLTGTGDSRPANVSVVWCLVGG
jgi:microcystin-dependent protein